MGTYAETRDAAGGVGRIDEGNSVKGGALPLLLALVLASCTGARVISGFGDLTDGEGYRRSRPHGGIDVWGSPGDAVLAAADGRVLQVGEERRFSDDPSCGKYVVLEHDVPNVLISPKTTYCHLSTVSVKADDLVKRGDSIGTIGTTGWRRTPIQTTGYEHVHWELDRGRGKVDPLPATEGCFDLRKAYPTDRLVLTFPVQCKN